MTGSWIRRFHAAPDARSRLLCLPHAGGSASYFFPVSRRLTPQVEVLAVQYPGRQDRHAEPCVDTIEGLADQVSAAMAPWLDRPLALFGHSMGAAVAFEVAMRLERTGTAPAALFVSGRRAPSRFREETVHLRDDDGVLAEVRLLSGTASQVLADDDLIRMALPAIRNDYRAIELYRGQPDATVRCPVYALVGDDDPKATIAEVDAWREHTNGDFELQIFPGGHFYLDQQVTGVLEKITSVVAAH